MKAIIEVKDLASVTFKHGNKTVDWSALTRDEQQKFIGACASFHNLFSKFIKDE